MNLPIIKMLELTPNDSIMNKIGYSDYRHMLNYIAYENDVKYDDNEKIFLIDNIQWATTKENNWLWNSKFKYLKLKNIIKTIVLDCKNNTNFLQSNMQKYETGKSVVIKECIKEKYEELDWVNDILIITNIVTDSKENKFYNDSMGGMQLMYFKTINGKKVSCPLYEYEVERYEESKLHCYGRDNIHLKDTKLMHNDGIIYTFANNYKIILKTKENIQFNLINEHGKLIDICQLGIPVFWMKNNEVQLNEKERLNLIIENLGFDVQSPNLNTLTDLKKYMKEAGYCDIFINLLCNNKFTRIFQNSMFGDKKYACVDSGDFIGLTEYTKESKLIVPCWFNWVFKGIQIREDGIVNVCISIHEGIFKSNHIYGFINLKTGEYTNMCYMEDENTKHIYKNVITSEKTTIAHALEQSTKIDKTFKML